MAMAHEDTGQVAGALAGLAHPVSGLDHVLAMIAVGLWGAVLGLPAIWVLPVASPMVMAFGGMLGLLGITLPAGANARLYRLGFVVATGLLHAVGIGLGFAHRWSAGRHAVRAAGAGVALAGLFFRWRAFR
jgi:urease accessory protein